MMHAQVLASTADICKPSVNANVSPKKMNHLLLQMKNDGWLTVDGENSHAIITSTTQGQDKVEHLFELGAQQEAVALGETGKPGQERLIALLRTVIANTND